MAKTAPTRRTSAARSARRTSGETRSSQNVTDTTQPHGLAGPNARLRPGRATGQTFGVSSRTQSVGRAAATSDQERARNERRLPAANARPRAAATSAAATRGRQRARMSDGERKRAESAQILVVATQMGYYDDLRRRPGDVFYIHADEDFSDLWMEDAPKGAEPSVTLGQEDIDRQHDEILGERAGSRARKGAARGVAGNVNTEREARTLSEAQRRQQGIQRGRDDVNQDEIPQGTDNPLGAED